MFVSVTDKQGEVVQVLGVEVYIHTSQAGNPRSSCYSMAPT